MRHALLPLALLAAACDFVPEVPPGAVILCANDAECPEGLLCDDRHECVLEGAVAPTLVEARFEPAFARLGDTVRLTVVADLPLVDVGLAFEAGSEDAQLLVTTEGASATWTLERTVDDAMLEGSYRLASLDLVGEDGARAVFDVVETGFVVDKTPPTLRNPRADDGTPADGLTLADTAGFDAFTVLVDVSEPFASVDLTVGTLSTSSGEVTCGANPLVSLGVRCDGLIAPGSVADGNNVVTVTATDLAGNSGNAQLALPIDAKAPGVDPATTSVDIRGVGGVQLAALVLSGRMTVSFVADENLGATPTVKLDSGLVATEVSVSGRRVDAIIPVIDDSIGAGPHRVLATLTDLVGHSAEVQVPLPAPFEDGVPLTAGPVSQCLVVDDVGGVTCPDFDGDGFRGASPGCDDQLADDCDDLEATVHPGGLEIPGDGLDNDCGGDGDLPVDETTGVFVDGDAAAGGDGTRAAPFNDLDTGLAAAKAADLDYVFISASTAEYEQLTTVERSLIGGFDAATWTRGAIQSRIEVFVQVPVADGLGLVGVAMPGFQTTGRVHVIESDIFNADGASMECVRSAVGQFESAGVGTGDIRIVDCQLNSIDVRADTATLVRTSVSFDLFIGARGQMNFIDSAALGGVDVFDSTFRAFHSVIQGLQGRSALVSDLTSELTLVNTAFTTSASTTEVMALHPDTRLLIHGVVFPERGEIMAGFNADAAGLAALELCDYALCTSASDNVLGEYVIGNTPFTVDAASAPLVEGAGVNPFGFSAPPSLARDADGQCRPSAGFYDIGPDEL